MTEKIRTRFAPSPTGYLHIGGARTALFNWLFTRKKGGTFILRIEDTDQERSTEEATRAILEAMTWLGLTWDEGPFFQAQRLDLHRSMVARLLKEGKAYYCDCTPEELEAHRSRELAAGRKPKYGGRCREQSRKPGPGVVVRFRAPETGRTVVEDLIKGRVIFNNEELDDLVIERSDGYPTYNFAVVVDDALMEITHVIRGDDHLNNTPRQILLYEALGFPVPAFGHASMILGADKTRLSKRHGATSVMSYREMGYLPEALVNYLVRLGWSHGDQEIFGREELIEFFGLEAIGKSPAVFNPEKLLWLNQQYIKNAAPSRLAEELRFFWGEELIAGKEENFLHSVIGDLQGRAKTLAEMAQAGAFYFAAEVIYDPEAAASHLTAETMELLRGLAEELPEPGNFTKSLLETFLRDFATRRGLALKIIVPPLRVALTGKTVSPGIDELMATLGRAEVKKRLCRALDYIGERAS